MSHDKPLALVRADGAYQPGCTFVRLADLADFVMAHAIDTGMFHPGRVKRALDWIESGFADIELLLDDAADGGRWRCSHGRWHDLDEPCTCGEAS